MADNSRIEWTDATWNPIAGCSRVSEGCRNCYAERMAKRLAAMGQEKYIRLTSESGRWTGRTTFDEGALMQPIKWRKPRRVFVCSMSDLFHESVPDEWIDRVFAVMALAPQHTYQILTKRPERMRQYLREVAGDGQAASRIWSEAQFLAIAIAMWKSGGQSAEALNVKVWPLPHVWLGVSVENQATADERIPILLDTPAAVRWISAEPLLGPVDLNHYVRGATRYCLCVDVEGAIRNRSFHGYSDDSGRSMSPAEVEAKLRNLHAAGVKLVPAAGCDAFDPDKGCQGHRQPRLSWVVVGGESGPHARPMHPEWARSLRDQCAGAGVAFHFKQHGEWIAKNQCSIDVDGEYQLVSPALRNASLKPWGAITHDGEFFPETTTWNGTQNDPDHGREVTVYRVGKKAAGRILDGRTHNEYPEVSHG